MVNRIARFSGGVGSILGVLFVVSGCVSAYRPPTPDEPHAILKYRRYYEAQAGSHLDELLTVEGHRAYAHTRPAEEAEAPATDGLLVHPRPAELTAASTFFVYTTQNVQETYYVSVPYTTSESYNCGTGTSYRTCTRTVTRYRQEPRTRWVTKTVKVPVEQCSDSVWFRPKIGATYLVELAYQGDMSCRLVCSEQVRHEDGSFTTEACEMPTEEEVQVALKRR
jgi:hypothetical protein